MGSWFLSLAVLVFGVLTGFSNRRAVHALTRVRRACERNPPRDT